MIPGAQKEWDILRRAAACTACAKAFAPGDEACSRLSVAGAELNRADFCAACWAAQPEDATALFWRSRVRDEAKPRRDLYDAAELFEILKRLLEEADPARDRLVYLLALYCSRKRLLRLRGIERKDGVELLRFVAPRTRREYRVRSVDLTPADMASARDELSRIGDGA